MALHTRGNTTVWASWNATPADVSTCRQPLFACGAQLAAALQWCMRPQVALGLQMEDAAQWRRATHKRHMAIWHPSLYPYRRGICFKGAPIHQTKPNGNRHYRLGDPKPMSLGRVFGTNNDHFCVFTPFLCSK